MLRFAGLSAEGVVEEPVMKVFRVVAFLAGLTAAAPLWAQAQFPTEGLEQRIDFWKKIFTQYGADDIVIHDTFHVNLIYDVATDKDVNTKKAAVRSALRELSDTLTKPEDRSPAARQIAKTISSQGLSLTAGTLNSLMQNIHTQRGIKERFRDGIVRSGRFLGEFQEILKTAGVPEDLALLPLVESSFQNVRSKAAALGIWQFTRSTGRLYMKVGGTNDERLDPIKATKAAAKLLKTNYDTLGEWPLAITAYNHGRAGMQRAKNLHGTEIPTIIQNYKSPLWGYASMNFYSEFLAAVEVYRSHPTYFGELVLDTPGRFTPQPVQVAAVTPAKPSITAKAKTPAASAEKYKVRRGDTLSDLATRFGTTIRSLMELNNLEKSVIYAGQILLVR
jgi:membrane-bound lytic murein transglycosylase D